MLSYNTTTARTQINAIATRSLLDEDFKAEILTGTRSKRLQEYPLPATVHQAVMDINAENLNQFILKLHQIITR